MAESVVSMLALISIIDLVAVVLNKWWIDPLDAICAITFTVVASLILIILSAKYNLHYTWIGVGILTALFVYGAVLASKTAG